MPAPNFLTFAQLHRQSEPLLLPNAWDARSAATSQASGYPAVGTSSAAIASSLGYADGEQMPFGELLFVVKRICAATTLPVTVDVEAGYSRDVATICTHLAQLAELGVVGINIEDSVVEDSRELVDAADFARTLEQLKAYCVRQGLNLFLNARTDTYLLGAKDALAQTQARLSAYEAAGADGIFVPCLTNLADIEALCQQARLPVNVMCMPDLADLAILAQAGVKRVSTGNFPFEFVMKQYEQLSATIQQERRFTALF